MHNIFVLLAENCNICTVSQSNCLLVAILPALLCCFHWTVRDWSKSKPLDESTAAHCEVSSMRLTHETLTEKTFLANICEKTQQKWMFWLNHVKEITTIDSDIVSTVCECFCLYKNSIKTHHFSEKQHYHHHKQNTCTCTTHINGAFINYQRGGRGVVPHKAWKNSWCPGKSIPLFLFSVWLCNITCIL